MEVNKDSAHQVPPGEIIRLTVACKWITEDGPSERHYSLERLEQWLPWERLCEVLDYLEIVCREAQAERNRHQPPERRIRLS
jgi:hypothetical protein